MTTSNLTDDIIARWYQQGHNRSNTHMLIVLEDGRYTPHYINAYDAEEAQNIAEDYNTPTSLHVDTFTYSFPLEAQLSSEGVLD